MNSIKPMVSVLMLTYGHENYIRQAIEGVLMQKSNFAIELIVADDCSPDRTESIISLIIDTHINGDWIKYTRHEQNKGMNANFVWASEQCKGKYIALCEGDDYWTDPLKLQKQVDFLETNASYSMTCSNVEILSCSGFIRKRFNFENSFDIDAYYLLKNNHISTCTVLANSSFVKSVKPIQMNFQDKYIWLSLLQTGCCFYLNEVTARYRMHGMGSYTSLKEYSKAIKRIEDYIKYKIIFPSLRKELSSQIYLTSIKGILSCIKHSRYKELFQLFNLIILK